MEPAKRSSGHPARGLAFPALALAFGFLGVRGTDLWWEFHSLRRAWADDVNSRLIGFPGITPTYSYAQGPSNWLHDEAENTLLWAGWDRKAKKHQWFTLGKGEVTAEHLSHPMGRDSIRAIDKPKIESRIGEIWKAIPPGNLVATTEFQGVALAYPMGVLDKVLIVNDMIHSRPILIVFTPFVHERHAVEMFNPIVNGTERRTMGHAGYLWDSKPLLYDRETLSLWVPSSEGLKCVAGNSKGTVITRLAHLEAEQWENWSYNHPDGRLLAGAIRADWKNPKP